MTAEGLVFRYNSRQAPVMWSYYGFPLFYYASYQFLSTNVSSSTELSSSSSLCQTVKLHLIAACLAYLPTYIQSLSWCFKDGYRIKSFQQHWIWKYFAQYFSTSINLEEPLNPNQLYIFCVFPHGAMSLNHFVMMTDCNQMLSKHYPAKRRDLAATVLFLIPIIKDVIMEKLTQLFSLFS